MNLGPHISSMQRSDLNISGIRLDFLNNITAFVQSDMVVKSRAIIYFNSGLHYIGDRGSFVGGYSLFKKDLIQTVKVYSVCIFTSSALCSCFQIFKEINKAFGTKFIWMGLPKTLEARLSPDRK